MKPAKSSGPQAVASGSGGQQTPVPIPGASTASKGTSAQADAGNGSEALPPPPAGNAPKQLPPGTTAAPPEAAQGRVKRVFASHKAESQGLAAATAVASTPSQGTLVPSQGAAVRQQHAAGNRSSSDTKAAVLASSQTAATGAPVAKTASAPQPASVLPAKAVVNSPAHSFDGVQSFISLEVDDAPKGGAAPVDQLSPASRKTKRDRQTGNEVTVSTQVQAPPQAAVTGTDPSRATASVHHSQGQPQQQQQGAPAVSDATEMEVDKQDIKPDLFAPVRPSSAVSPVSGGAQSQANADQKQLPAAKGKAAAKGNIQIVLATKHKQVLPCSRVCCILCVSGRSTA